MWGKGCITRDVVQVFNKLGGKKFSTSNKGDENSDPDH